MNRDVSWRGPAAFTAIVAGIMLSLAVALSGCVSQVTREHAAALHHGIAILHSATVPNPSYDAAGKALVERVWTATEAHAAALEDVTK